MEEIIKTHPSGYKHTDNLKPNGYRCITCDKELTGMSRKNCSQYCQIKRYKRKKVQSDVDQGQYDEQHDLELDKKDNTLYNA